MSEQKFNIRKVGANFVAYDTVDKNRSYGKINIKTGKFTGDTRCMIALNNHWETKVGNKQEELYDKVLEQIKQDVAVGELELQINTNFHLLSDEMIDKLYWQMKDRQVKEDAEKRMSK